MSTPLDLVLLVHMHLPAGGTAAECERAWSNCFEPMLGAIHHTPGVRIGLVLSGELVPDLSDRHPEGLDWIRTLVDRGQIELVGTAMYEPVLSSIPEVDAVGHYETHATMLRKTFGGRTTGAWLPHNVWDPSLPRVFSAAGLRWVAVPERHLERAGLPKGQVSGIHHTEREGSPVAILPVDSRVQDVAAEVPVKRILAHLRGRKQKGHKLVALALRAERFGLHPGSSPRRDQTWFATLLAAIARSDALNTVLPSQAVDLGGHVRSVYLPSTSPGTNDAPWESHLVRYDAADRLHKRVLRVSRLVGRLARRLEESRVDRPDPAVVLQARRYLYRAQASEPYWHDAHAGVYDPRVRGLAWKDAIRAENTVLKALKQDQRAVVEHVDVDCDGSDELVLRSRDLTLVVDPNRAGGAIELSDHRSHRNWLDTFQRIEEPYHAAIMASAESPKDVPVQVDTQSGTPAEDADRATLRHLSSILGFDAVPRTSFVEHFLSETDTIRTVRSGQQSDGAFPLKVRPWTVVSADRAGDDTLSAALACEATLTTEAGPRQVRATKRYTLRRDLTAFRYELENTGEHPVVTRLAVSMDLAVSSGAAAWLEVDNERVPLEGTRDCGQVESLRLVDGDRVVELRTLQPAHLWVYPIQTVHRHLGEWTDALQAVCLMWVHRVNISSGEHERFDVKLRVLPGTGVIPQP